MASLNEISWRYAPLWSVAFAGAATLAKSVGQRYILRRRVNFHWSDLAAAAGGALLGYVTFRMRHGDVGDAWYRR